MERRGLISLARRRIVLAAEKRKLYPQLTEQFSRIARTWPDLFRHASRIGNLTALTNALQQNRRRVVRKFFNRLDREWEVRKQSRPIAREM